MHNLVPSERALYRDIEQTPHRVPFGLLGILFKIYLQSISCNQPKSFIKNLRKRFVPDIHFKNQNIYMNPTPALKEHFMGSFAAQAWLKIMLLVSF